MPKLVRAAFFPFFFAPEAASRCRMYPQPAGLAELTDSPRQRHGEKNFTLKGALNIPKSREFKLLCYKEQNHSEKAYRKSFYRGFKGRRELSSRRDPGAI